MGFFSKKTSKKDIKADIELETKKAEDKKKLKKLANPKCNKCHGEGRIGWNFVYNQWVICKCVQRNLKIKQGIIKENKKQ
jgi:hypothetical protein